MIFADDMVIWGCKEEKVRECLEKAGQAVKGTWFDIK